MIQFTIPETLFRYLEDTEEVWFTSPKQVGETWFAQLTLDDLDALCYQLLPELMDMWLTNSTEESYELYGQAAAFLEEREIYCFT